MSTFTLTKTMTCCHCGQVTERHSSPDTLFGGSDLDTRPSAHPPQDTVYRCPQCHYCAYDLSESLPGISEVLASAEYQAALTNDAYREGTQNRFCLALLYEHAGQLVDAGWCYVRIAWSSDDGAEIDHSQAFRLKAVHYFERAITTGTQLSNVPGADELFLCDLLRRAGVFDRAFNYCNSGLAVVEDKTIQDLLHYEKTLIEVHDLRCHTSAKTVHLSVDA